MYRYTKYLLDGLVSAVADADQKLTFEHFLAFEYRKNQEVRVALLKGVPYFFVTDLCGICKIHNPVKHLMDVPDKCFAVSDYFAGTGQYELVILKEALYPLLGGSESSQEMQAFLTWMKTTILKLAEEKFQIDFDGLIEDALHRVKSMVSNPSIMSAVKKANPDPTELLGDDFCCVLHKTVAGVSLDCYRVISSVNPDRRMIPFNTVFWLPRKQIGQLLGYSDAQGAIAKIHNRYKDELDQHSLSCKIATMGGIQTTVLYSFRGIVSICQYSRRPHVAEVIQLLFELADEINKQYGE